MAAQTGFIGYFSARITDLDIVWKPSRSEFKAVVYTMLSFN
ncbi:hypothetical protein CPTD_02059 [Corynebacterium pseudotuberculosis]|nr:hypothetical protein CPTA_00231 [Corynebacterium pseudotuberculosis]AIG09354.1 hypothetical protein CPTB_01298 [Corynebacterium pseudotuberculosis]AIG11255.1 hypothetical protein CPTC_00967 [Corynebacterium pseudotuberculosis]AQL51957.1 hypothetical protein CpPA04_1871 [Corynebacterium pseudotuberculosis]KEX87305.1 hypothetical protein CPTD_02059 [Corynebacterium pseudotuberculosis]